MTTAADPSRAQTSVSRSGRGLRGRLRTALSLLAALVGVALGAFTLPTAAQAADFEHWISGGTDPYLDVGGAEAYVTVEVKATFRPHEGPRDVTLTASLSGVDGHATVDVLEGACVRTGAGQVTCQGMQAEEQRQVQFIIAPAPESDLPEGETRTGELRIDAGGQGNGAQKTSVTVVGHAQAGVASITGKVTSNAEPVAGADVVLNDGEGTDHKTTTNDAGEFSFPSGGETIAPGAMTLTVTKDGYEEEVVEFEVAAGGSNNRNLTLTEVQEEEPAESSEPPPTTEAASEEPSAAGDENGGGISGTLLVLIIVGGLLVVGGIVGIVLLLRGGKDDDEDEDEGFPTDSPPEHSPTAAQIGSPGVYQAGPAPGGDAPTMVHNGPLVSDDEVGAYGAPSAFGPAYGADAGADSTQVMPQAGAGQSPASPPAVGPDGTQILPTLKNVGGPGAPGGSDATQVMPQANLGSQPPAPAPPSAFGDLGATRPHPSPTPPPSAPPSPSSPFASRFEPSQQGDPNQFEPPPTPSAPPPGARDPYAPPEPSQPPMPPSQPGAGSFASGSRDPYAPPPEPSAPPPGPYTPAPTQAMPQSGFGGDRPPSPYAAEASDPNQWQGRRDEGGDQAPGPDRSQRPDEEHRGWGEWDDRPRSW